MLPTALPIILALAIVPLAEAVAQAPAAAPAPAALPAPAPTAAPTPALGPPAATQLRGQVLDAAGRPLPGVNVFLKGTFDGATTDSLGRYAFSTSAGGARALVSTLVGYQLQEELLALPSGGGELAVPVRRLRESRAALGEVVVAAGAFAASATSRAAVLKPLDVLTTAGANADIAAALNTLPGTTRVGEEGRLFVRGGAASETRTYLDGLPVQSPYSGTTAGLPARGRFSPTLFKGVNFSTGGYSAEYGQALSAVVALNTVDLDPETQTGLTALSVGGSASRVRRWTNTSLALSADYTNLTPYLRLAAPASRWPQPPRSLGGSVRLAHRSAHDGMLKLYATFSDTRVASRQPSPDPGYGPDGQLSALHNQNYYLNATYRRALPRGWGLSSGLALAREANDVQPEPLAISELTETATARLVLTNDSASTWFNLKLGTETAAQRYHLRYQAAGDAPVLAAGFTEVRPALFAESDLSLAPRLTGRVGVRGEYSGLLRQGSLAPRLALAWRLGSSGQLSAAGGLFYQNPTADLLRVQPALGYERATHYLLSYQRLTLDRTLRVELYYKDYAGLVRYAAANPLDATAYANSGQGYARGLDVFWRDRYRTFKHIDFWVSYGLLDTRRQARADLAAAVPTFAATHNLSLVGKYWLPKLHLQLSGTYSYGSPRAYYNPNEAGYNQGRTPSFQQLDLSVSYLTRLAGQFTILHLGATNALGRDNIYGYRYAQLPDAAGRYASAPTRSLMPQMLVAAVLISINKKTPGDTSVAPD